jgi:predicted small secreted protein
MLGDATAESSNRHQRIITMRTHLTIALTFLLLIGAAPLLGACHTTAGAGEDISATGHAITHGADKATP